MAIKFEKIQPGMTLYDRHHERAGNTTMKRLREWPVRILSVDPATGTAKVVWNHNADRPKTYWRSQLERLYDWSMYDETEAVRVEGLVGTTRVRRLPAAERKRLKAERDAERARARQEGFTP